MSKFLSLLFLIAICSSAIWPTAAAVAQTTAPSQVPAKPPAAPAVAPVLAQQAPPPSAPQTIPDPQAWSWRDFAIAIPSFIALAGVFATIYFSYRSTKATLNQKTNELEIKSISEKLDGFYGPFLQRSQENLFLANDFRSRQPAGFRTLIALLDPNWLQNLSPGNKTMVDEIIKNGLELRTMVREKAEAVDPMVVPYLAQAGVHFTMLSLAHSKSLDNQPETYVHFVYPRHLDAVLQAEVKRLRARLGLLMAKPTEAHPPIVALVLPKDLKIEPAPPTLK